MKTVLITASYMLPFLDRFIPILESFGLKVIVAEVEERMEVDDLMPYAGQIDGTICGDDRYTAGVLRAFAPRLKVIAKWGTGIDSIDLDVARELGIPVLNTPNAFSVPVAESVLTALLCFARNLPWMDAAMKRGEWKKINGHTLSESTVGVIGVGNVGKAVLRRVRGFGSRLLGYDVADIAPDFIFENRVEMTDLRSLLEQSDYVCLCSTLTSSSNLLIDAEKLSWMKPNAVLVNASRGSVVVEKDLIEALQNGKIRGAALDVFEFEPLPKDSPLRKMDNVLLSPHNTNSSPFYWERVHWNSIRNLLLGLDIPVGDIESLKRLEKKNNL